MLYGLEKISCFDTFPFHKIPISQSLYQYEEKLDEAYDKFLNMIQQKQPDVVFYCYRQPTFYQVQGLPVHRKTVDKITLLEYMKTKRLSYSHLTPSPPASLRKTDALPPWCSTSHVLMMEVLYPWVKNFKLCAYLGLGKP